MEGMRELYGRALRRRAYEELKEVRAKFWTNTDANIIETKSCELDAKRYVKEIQRYQELMEMELEGGIY